MIDDYNNHWQQNIQFTFHPLWGGGALGERGATEPCGALKWFPPFEDMKQYTWDRGLVTPKVMVGHCFEQRLAKSQSSSEIDTNK